MRRVAITGMGAICALGHDGASSWQAMREGRSGIGPIVNIPTEQLQVKVAAEVRGYDPRVHFEAKQLSLLDPVSQFALTAAREAIAQAGLDFSDGERGMRTACIVGTCLGGEYTRDEASRRFHGEKQSRIDPLCVIRLMANGPVCHISMEFGITGPVFAVVSACASSNHALAQAFQMVRDGTVDFAIAGGAEAYITVPAVKAWEAMRLTAGDTCRPFCKQRRGLVLGEGAGIFVLEDYEHACRRGARILAEFAGAGIGADASNIVLPSEAGAIRAITAALEDAQLLPEHIDYINAHGTATPANDPTESRAIRRVFGTHADRLAVSSTKSMHGHAMGATGALELVAVIGALSNGVIPPTANFIDPDPQCDLDYVPNTARVSPVRAALSNSFAFGGLNAVLAFKRVN